MGVRRFEDLDAWKLAAALKDEVFAFTDIGSIACDRKYCDQIRESTRSATRNIAEGFGRYYPKEFARYLRIAIASLHETKDQLHEGNARRYLSDEKYTHLVRLTLRAIKASNRLLRYLLQADAPDPRPMPPKLREPPDA